MESLSSDESSIDLSTRPRDVDHEEEFISSVDMKIDDEEQTILQQLCEKVEMLSDQITDILPAWSKVIGKIQTFTGYKKRYILLALVSCCYFSLLFCFQNEISYYTMSLL